MLPPALVQLRPVVGGGQTRCSVLQAVVCLRSSVVTRRPSQILSPNRCEAAPSIICCRCCRSQRGVPLRKMLHQPRRK